MTSNNCFGSAGFDGAGFASAEQQPGEMSSDEPPSRCIFDLYSANDNRERTAPYAVFLKSFCQRIFSPKKYFKKIFSV